MSSPSFVLVHSPLVGPTTWRWVAEALRRIGHRVVVPSALGFHRAGPPYWSTIVDAVVAGCADVAGPVLVAGHSGAGPLLPAVADRLGDRVDGLVWVEATLPPPEGRAPLVPDWLGAQLADLAEDGVLPRWSEWWGPGAMAQVVPDPERRAAVEAELPRLPRAVFDESAPVPPGWEERWRHRLVWCSDVFGPEADAAARRGRPVERVEGGHLHLAVDPDAIAAVLVRA